MHELSLAGGIVKLVEDAAARDHFSRVSQLRLEAGALSGVEVRALRFALDAVTPGTCLAGAQIEITEPPGTAWCLPCGSSVVINQRGEPVAAFRGRSYSMKGKALVEGAGHRQRGRREGVLRAGGWIGLRRRLQGTTPHAHPQHGGQEQERGSGGASGAAEPKG